MIDLKLLRASPGQVRAALARRGDASLTRLLDEIEALDMKRRTLTAQLDTLKAERNDAAKSDALAAKSGGLSATVVAERRKLGERITGLESELRQIETTLEAKALFALYAKLHVLAIDTVARRIDFEILTNVNCGYRGLEEGLPKR